MLKISCVYTDMVKYVLARCLALMKRVMCSKSLVFIQIRSSELRSCSASGTAGGSEAPAGKSGSERRHVLHL